VRDTEAFIAFSYPPDTVAIVDQAQTRQFNPKVMYVGIGGAFPMFRKRFGNTVEGLLTHGGIDLDKEGTRHFLKRHMEVTGLEPDHSGMIVTHAALQAFEQAIERVGSLDYNAISEELKKGTFDTVLGKINLGKQEMDGIYKAGQYRDGIVRGLSPRSVDGAGKLVVPKQPWPAR
jgi:branched-chain amino acid transport system substrate-binding protein